MQHTTTQPRMAAITQQTIMNKSHFFLALAAFGVVNILMGLMSLVSAIIPFSSTSILILAGTNIADAVFELFLGVLILASCRAFTKGKSLALWLYSASILMEILYKLLMGSPINYVFVGFGAFMVWQLLKFRQQWEAL